MDIKKIHFKNIQYSLEKGKVLCYIPTAFEKLQGKKERSYTIEGTLGQGGFGITYLASIIITVGNVKQKVYFAIKEYFVKGQCWRETGDARMLLPKAEEARMDVLKWMDEFEDEAKRLNEICKSNPHVVNVNEVFRANDTAYYVMEFLDGGSLKEMIDEQNGLSEADALSIILPIAKTVSDLHQNHHIIHCDIKPDNIMMRMNDDDTLFPVLIDFGESRHLNPDGSLTSKRNAVGGSPSYAPLEQSAGEITEQVDVYALGATLLHVLSGKKPQGASSVDDTYILDKLPQTTSARVSDAIIHAMQTSKHNRTKRVADFINEIESGINPVPESVPDELPIGHVLNSKGKNFRIVSQGQKESFYIKYKAERCPENNDDSQSSTTKTKRAKYDIYEFFVDGIHHRNKDLTLSADGSLSEGQQQFLSFCDEKTTHTVSRQFTSASGFGWATFGANNTFYLVWSKASISKPLPWKRIVTYTAACAGTLLLIYGVVSTVRMMSETKKRERLEMSQRLTHVIETNNADSLRIFAVGHDSTRAYLPYAQVSLEYGDFETAKVFAEKAKSNSLLKTHADSLLKVIAAKSDSIETAHKEQVYDSLLNVAKQHYSSSDYEAAKAAINEMDSEFRSRAQVQKLVSDIKTAVGRDLAEERNDSLFNAAKSQYGSSKPSDAKATIAKMDSEYRSRLEVEKLAKKIEEALQPTDDKVYQKALKENDYTTIETLANKGYSKAYYPLAAWYYKKKKNLTSAKKWANKAITAKVDVAKSSSLVVEINKNSQAEDAYNKAEKYLKEKAYDKALCFAKKAKSLGSNHTKRLKEIISECEKWDPPIYTDC